MDKKKMLTYGAIVVVVAIIAWFGFDMVGGGGGDAAVSNAVIKPNPDIPKPAAFNTLKATNNMQQPQIGQQQPMMTEREMQLMRLQQETQAKYLAALNELQMLKVEKDIAETNKDISKAKLDTISAQKDIVDLLSPQKPTVSTDSYVQGLDRSANAAPTPPANQSQNNQAQLTANDSGASYTVVSVSQLRGQWTAVIGSQGRLYNVKQGDVLAADSSVVLSINRSGVVLERDGKRQKVSMVPII